VKSQKSIKSILLSLVLLIVTALALIGLTGCTIIIGKEPSPPGEQPAEQPPEEGPPPVEVHIAFTADRTELQPGECAILEWSVEGGFGVDLNEQLVERSGQMQVCPEETTPYWLGVDTGETIERREVMIFVAGAEEPPPLEEHPPEEQPPEGEGVEFINLMVEPDVIPPGECAMLHWEVMPPGEWPVFLDGREVPHVGGQEVCPGNTTTYELLVEAPGGPQERMVTLHVEGEPEPEQPPEGEGVEVINLVIEPDVIPPGVCAMLHWEVMPPGEWPVLLNGQEVPHVGEQEVCPGNTTTYELLVEAPGGPQERTVTLHVEGGPGSEPSPEPTPVPPAGPTPTPAPPTGPTPPGCPGPPVIASFTANPSTITAGQSSTLSWGAVTNATSAMIDQGIGGVATPGSVVVKPTKTTTYILTATGCGGATTKQVTVNVTGAPPPTPWTTDLAVTDLYPDKLKGGTVYGRITNHGPGTCTNVQIQFSCSWVKTAYGATFGLNESIGPSKITITSLNPGQTASFNTGIVVDITQFWYDMTCSIQVPFNDPDTANNSYPEKLSK
jgi:hypothetical protein